MMRKKHQRFRVPQGISLRWNGICPMNQKYVSKMCAVRVTFQIILKPLQIPNNLMKLNIQINAKLRRMVELSASQYTQF